MFGSFMDRRNKFSGDDPKLEGLPFFSIFTIILPHWVVSENTNGIKILTVLENQSFNIPKGYDL